MKRKLNNEKGVTLVMLMLVIIILAILAGVTISNIDTGVDIRNYNYMKADIELLESKINVYYNNNFTLPTKGEKIQNLDLSGQASQRDNENYYQIDISLLNNITLNYGGGTIENKDIYIINEQSHEIYYLKGAMYENKLYHRVP